MFKELFTETFITRLVNDAKDELKEMFPKHKIEFIKMNDYDTSKHEVKEIKKKEGKILYIEGKKKILFDFKK